MRIGQCSAGQCNQASRLLAQRVRVAWSFITPRAVRTNLVNIIAPTSELMSDRTIGPEMRQVVSMRRAVFCYGREGNQVKVRLPPEKRLDRLLNSGVEAMLTVGNKFPEFCVKACRGNTPEGLCEVTNKTYTGKWQVLFFYPKDFTFVCPTELVEFGKHNQEFNRLNAVLLAGSTDNEYSHLAWRQADPRLGELPYPMIAAQKLAADLGILDPSAHVCLRATFIVDPQGTIQWASANNLSTGRSVPEVLRVLAALQSGELTGCNWQPGDKFVKG